MRNKVSQKPNLQQCIKLNLISSYDPDQPEGIQPSGAINRTNRESPDPSLEKPNFPQMV